MPCSKIGFETKDQALEEAKATYALRKRMGERNWARPNKRMRPYMCEHCSKWHLTSQKSNVKHYRKRNRKIRRELCSTE